MIKEILRPKVSVIIPMYKVEDCISRCLDSCMEQTLRDIEIICVDDGSPDNSGQIAEIYARMDPRIQVVHQENKGLSGARNAGLRKATADLLMFLDSDDFLHPWACARMWEETLQRPVDIIVFGADVFPAGISPDKWFWWALSPRANYYPEFIPDALFKEVGAYPFVWRHAYTRRVLERSGVMFDESVRFGEDVIFQLEVFPYAQQISFLPDRAYNYRLDRKDSLMDIEKRDQDAKMTKHIAVVDKTAVFWNERHLMEKYGPQYLEWALEYIISDLQKYEFKDRRALVSSFEKVLENRNVLAFKDALSAAGRKRLRQLMAMR